MGVNALGWAAVVVALPLLVAAAVADRSARRREMQSAQTATPGTRRVGVVCPAAGSRKDLGPQTVTSDLPDLEPDACGVIWLPRDPKLVKKLSGLKWRGTALVGLGAVPAMVVSVGGFLWALLWGVEGVALGWDGRAFHLRSALGRQEVVIPEQMVVTARRVHVRHASVPTEHPQQNLPFFELSYFDRYAGPHLVNATQSSDFRHLLRKLSSGDVVTRTTSILIAAFLVTAVWLEFAG